MQEVKKIVIKTRNKLRKRNKMTQKKNKKKINRNFKRAKPKKKNLHILKTDKILLILFPWLNIQKIQ